VTPASTLEGLSPAEIDAIAALWRREQRTLVTSFTGASMLPAIAPGQQVAVTCGVESAVGDVAVFRFDNQVGVHRVVARTATWILTWGDANPLPDLPITPSQLIGVIRDVPAVRPSRWRAMLLLYLTSRSVPVDLLTRRVALVYRVSSLWSQGPLVFVGAAAQAIFRRLSIC
jgi:hypothetical protein